MIKLFIGYDLGDGETVVSYYKVEKKDSKNNIFEKKDEGKFLMPSKNVHGIPIPTAYAKTKDGEFVLGDEISRRTSVKNVVSNFKKQPSSLLSAMTKEEYEEISSFFDNNDIDCWSVKEIADNKALLVLRDRIVQFTNALFTNNKFADQFAMLTNDMNPDSDLIVFYVGHPTKWSATKTNENPIDVSIYKKIFEQSIIGKNYFDITSEGMVKRFKSELFIKPESRAAFLYARDKYISNENGAWIMDKSRMVIDVGSSTIDVTSFKKTSTIEKRKETNDSEKEICLGHRNSGLSFLGARIIDWFIFDLFMKQTNNILRDDFEIDDQSQNKLLLKCRIAKEKLYTAIDALLKEHPDFTAKDLDIELMPETIDFQNPAGGKLSIDLSPSVLLGIEDLPIADVLKKHLGLPEYQIKETGRKSWKESYECFLQTEMHELKKSGYEIEEIILTGSASKMPFIRMITEKIAKDIFEDASVYDDPNPGFAIAGGLPLFGVSEEKSKKFKQEIDDFIEYGLRNKIKAFIPSFADTMGGILSNLTIDKIIMPILDEWKTHTEITVNDLMESMRKRCTKSNIGQLLSNDEGFIKASNAWSSSLLKSINDDLDKIFEKYDVGREKLNLIKQTYANSDINIGGLGILDTLVMPINIIVDVISYSLVAIVVIIAALFIPKAFILVGAKLAGKSIQDVIDEIQNGVTKSFAKAKIPSVFKGSAYNKALKELECKRDEIKSKVSNDIKSDETINNYTRDFSNSIKPRIEKAVEVIEYFIEDKN